MSVCRRGRSASRLHAALVVVMLCVVGVVAGYALADSTPVPGADSGAPGRFHSGCPALSRRRRARSVIAFGSPRVRRGLPAEVGSVMGRVRRLSMSGARLWGRAGRRPFGDPGGSGIPAVEGDSRRSRGGIRGRDAEDPWRSAKTPGGGVGSAAWPGSTRRGSLRRLVRRAGCRDVGAAWESRSPSVTLGRGRGRGVGAWMRPGLAVVVLTT